MLVSLPRSTLFPFTSFFFNDTATTEIYTLSLHDALPIWDSTGLSRTEEPAFRGLPGPVVFPFGDFKGFRRSPGVVDLIRDAAADVEPPTGKPDSAGLRKQQIGNAIAIG